MKFLTEYITFNTKKRREFINITREVNRVFQRAILKRAWS